jgi:peptide/nickel transport system substrate-binding protein
MIDTLLAAKSQGDFVTAVRALDRVLLSGFYIVPLYHARNQWIAASTALARPAKLPAYGSPTLDDTFDSWWRQKP